MSLLSCIGNTLLVELSKVNPNPRVRLLAKRKGNNPGDSVKDRAALYLLSKAEESGELTPDKTILEPTSGNTDIAIAMIGAAKGYRVKLALGCERYLNTMLFCSVCTECPPRERCGKPFVAAGTLF
jgi:S-sulfo-L-cysteine synthase (O-acetyl-L-serine-dependent)